MPLSVGQKSDLGEGGEHLPQVNRECRRQNGVCFQCKVTGSVTHRQVAFKVKGTAILLCGAWRSMEALTPEGEGAKQPWLPVFLESNSGNPTAQSTGDETRVRQAWLFGGLACSSEFDIFGKSRLLPFLRTQGSQERSVSLAEGSPWLKFLFNFSPTQCPSPTPWDAFLTCCHGSSRS